MTIIKTDKATIDFKKIKNEMEKTDSFELSVISSATVIKIYAPEGFEIVNPDTSTHVKYLEITNTPITYPYLELDDGTYLLTDDDQGIIVVE